MERLLGAAAVAHLEITATLLAVVVVVVGVVLYTLQFTEVRMARLYLSRSTLPSLSRRVMQVAATGTALESQDKILQV
jgi:type IV secretory pathway VirB3-like protein